MQDDKQRQPDLPEEVQKALSGRIAEFNRIVEKLKDIGVEPEEVDLELTIAALAYTLELFEHQVVLQGVLPQVVAAYEQAARMKAEVDVKQNALIGLFRNDVEAGREKQ